MNPAPIIKAVATPELAAMPTLSNMEVNLFKLAQIIETLVELIDLPEWPNKSPS